VYNNSFVHCTLYTMRPLVSGYSFANLEKGNEKYLCVYGLLKTKTEWRFSVCGWEIGGSNAQRRVVWMAFSLWEDW